MRGPTVVLFTRDLRVHDHPALHAAAALGPVVPLFVFDDEPLRTFGATNRVKFLVESLEDLRSSLLALGSDLWVRRGDTVSEVVRLAGETAASAIFLSTDASAFAERRVERLRSGGLEVKMFPGIAAVDPGALTPASGDHYRVFTPYLRAWSGMRRRKPLAAPSRLTSPSEPPSGPIPSLRELGVRSPSPDVVEGGESKGRIRIAAWLSEGVRDYDDQRDQLAADATSRSSAYLHFGCLSSVEVMAEAPGDLGGEGFVRQLCWRDFFLQVLAARPDYPRSDYRAGPESWVDDSEGLDRWERGVTGVPIVDAGMRQLLQEGWMHNRARLITASYLTRTLKIDWRKGAEHFWKHLVDGDLASNAGNWQWVAGTGNATRPGNVMVPLRQAKRFDARGDFVQRYVPELADLDPPLIHEPWKLGERELRILNYPSPHAPAVDPSQTTLLI